MARLSAGARMLLVGGFRHQDSAAPVRAPHGGSAMFVSQTVMGFLDRHHVDFELVSHRHTRTSTDTARAAHVPLAQLAKGVLLLDPDEYLLAVVPASRHVNPFALRELVEREPIVLADESDMPYIFRDCECGALPIVGPAFGLATVVDDDLLKRRDVYFEAGDHEHLVHVSGSEFEKLMADQPHGSISY